MSSYHEQSYFLTIADVVLRSSVNESNRWPLSCRLIDGKIAKSNGARSGEYGGCCTDPKHSTPISSWVAAAVWEEALSMCSRKCSTGIPRRFFLRASTRSRRSTCFKMKYRLYIVSNFALNFYIDIKINYISH